MTEPTIKVSEAGFEMPLVDVLTGRGYIFGKSGSGKSNSLGVIAEEILDAGRPLCIVDADGEHFGLKEDYEILHVGADEVDVEVGPEHAEELAHVMLEEDVPVILDISGYIDEDDAYSLVEGVVSKLFSMEKKRKKTFPIFVEEIHEVVPEGKGLGSVGKAIVKVATRGRKHGLGLVGASQRPAKVKKDFVTQANWGVWHRLTWKNDTDVVKDVLGGEWAEAVQDLGDGEAIVTADSWLEEPRAVQFRRKRTFDAGETPGLDEFETPELKGVSEGVIDTLQSITEEKEAEADEKEELEAEVERLRSQKRSLESEVEDLRSGDAVESDEVERLQNRLESLKDERDSLEVRIEEVESARDEYAEEVSALESRVERLEDRLAGVEEAGDHLRSALASLGEPVEADQANERLRERIDELESERDRLQSRVERVQSEGEYVAIEDTDYQDFVDKEPVREAIREAKDEASPSAVKAVLGSIIEEEGPVSYDHVAEVLGHSQTTHVSSAATTLETYGIVKKEDVDGKKHVDFNLDGIEEIVRKKKKRERTQEVMENL